MKKNFLLLTNDDGYDSDGIKALSRTLSKGHRIAVSAPESQRSANSHSLSIHQTVSAKKLSDDNGLTLYSIGGTPADCVKLAVTTLLDHRPDLVVSGINSGVNLGINTFYSGTLAAAVEGALKGIPSFAISLDITESRDYSVPARVAARFAEFMLEHFRGTPVVFNVNVPGIPEDQINGVKLTRQDMAGFNDRYKLIDKAKGVYKITGEIMPERETDCDMDLPTDVKAIKCGFISVTPICLFRTDFGLIEKLQKKGTHDGFFC